MADVRSTSKIVEDLFSGISDAVHEETLDSLTVRDIMETSFVVVHPETDIRELLNIFLKENIHEAPVVNNQAVVGIINTWDIWHHLEQKCMEKGPNLSRDTFKSLVSTCAQHTVGDLMRKPDSISLEKSLLDALILMDESSLRILPVVKDGELIGLIRDEDIARVFLKALMPD